jgi:transcriptional regulator with XRE-family HTH domain
MHQNRMHDELGSDLRNARQAAGLTQSALGARAGCSVLAVRQAERASGSFPVLVSVAKAVDMLIGARSLPPGSGLSERLHALRERLGLGRRAAGHLAGISATTVAAIETGAAGHTSAVVKLAAALGVTLRLEPMNAPANYWGGAAVSSVHHGWTTPGHVLEGLYTLVGGSFGLDPCSPARRGPAATVRARVRLTAIDDALSMSWRAPTAFMNPPYGRGLKAWVAKAQAQHLCGNVPLMAALIPARPDTRWWHDHVADHADVWMLKGRLSFGDGSQAAPFPSAIVVWGATDAHRHLMAAAFPDAWHVRRRQIQAIPEEAA